MNIAFVKEKINYNIGKKVRVTVHGMRNRTDFYDGVIKNCYPNFFTIMYLGSEKSFNYRDVITNDISIKYL